jgi:hypothetical protein
VPNLTAIPATITSGDSYAITLSLAEYPAPTWALSFALAGVDVLSVSSTASGTSHLLTLTAAQTTALGAGLYQFRVRATSGSTVETVTTGICTVAADIGALAAGEGVSYWQCLKTAAEAALLTLVDSGAPQMVMINGRQTMFRSPDDLRRLISECNAQLAALSARTFGTPIRFNVVGMR